MRALTLLCLLCAAGATGADGGNASAPARRRLSWGASLDDGERLPGWQGELSRDGAAPHRHETKGDTYRREDQERGTWMELIAWRPRAYVIHNFMTPEECVDLVKTAKPFMARSTVVDSVTGESKVDPIRTRCGRHAPVEAAPSRACAARRRAAHALAQMAARACALGATRARVSPQRAHAPGCVLTGRRPHTASRRSSLAGSTRWSPSLRCARCAGLAPAPPAA